MPEIVDLRPSAASFALLADVTNGVNRLPEASFSSAFWMIVTNALMPPIALEVSFAAVLSSFSEFASITYSVGRLVVDSFRLSIAAAASVTAVSYPPIASAILSALPCSALVALSVSLVASETVLEASVAASPTSPMFAISSSKVPSSAALCTADANAFNDSVRLSTLTAPFSIPLPAKYVARFAPTQFSGIVMPDISVSACESARI